MIESAGERHTPMFLIIGAGFIGLSAALRLAELRRESGLSAEIVLADANGVASGPSGKNAGHVCGLQTSDAAVLRLCGTPLGNALIAAATEAQQLVRSSIARYGIDCDLRDGYVFIDRDGRQTVSTGGDAFGIDGRAFALGLADAAKRFGVTLLEGVAVTGLSKAGDGCSATSTRGTLYSSHVLASGGHRMAEDIGLLRFLRARTTELKVSTIISAPVPQAVLDLVFPGSTDRPFPFSTTSTDVAYGYVRADSRIVFGACATAFRDPNPEMIIRTAHKVLPDLRHSFRVLVGREISWNVLVAAERLCFTKNFLPNVGAVPGHRRILYAHAVGGHGIAVGTLLGRSAADRMWGTQFGTGTGRTAFDLFAAVKHGWLPPWQPLRGLSALIGLLKS